ncbi:MAG: tRNA (adenosine(37)-N6)-threonylcarbamoyltransferase complex dimerization subunit type 1 TsaB [Alistipes sp.]|nr:tRNA (adenosine(37)-N6)-threonylcarbamoyltransferase complex dimerization subunit type 1 TsaB [Alistipes sp.]
MALILCIETGTDICSVGIVNNGELISLRESDSGRDHAQKVGVFVDELLKENNIQPEELDAVAVGEGPGSYTGLRIGVSFAKGLCYGLNKPLIAISSLEALTAVAIEDYNAGIIDIEDWNKVKLCPMIDARRMEVYAQVFNSNGSPINAVAAEIVTDQSFAEYRDSDSSLVIFGSGAAKCADILGAKLIDITPSVRGMAAIAEKKFSSSDFVDVAYFEPYYLKDFVVTTSKKKLF